MFDIKDPYDSMTEGFLEDSLGSISFEPAIVSNPIEREFDKSSWGLGEFDYTFKNAEGEPYINNQTFGSGIAGAIQNTFEFTDGLLNTGVNTYRTALDYREVIDSLRNNKRDYVSNSQANYKESVGNATGGTSTLTKLLIAGVAIALGVKFL